MNFFSPTWLVSLLIVLALGTWEPLTRLQAAVIDFEDWSLNEEPFWIGPVPENEGTEQPGPHGGIDRIGTINVGSLALVNRHNLKFGNWSGFAISNRIDKTTPGFANQMSSFAGGGAGDGNDNYAVGFGYVDELNATDLEQLSSLPYFDVAAGKHVSSMLVTNTTYAALSMLEGDGFAKAFGGVTGNDPDFLRLSVYGVDTDGVLLDEIVELFLADYRFSNNSEDFIVDGWTNLDLSRLSDAKRLYFNLDSTDTNMSGMTTPAYFAIDNIVLERDLIGDLNLDGVLDASDADLLCQGITDGLSDTILDLDRDGLIGMGDISILLAEARVKPGDANFDGSTQFDDFLQLSANFGQPGSWSHGDFDCDGLVGFPDFLSLSSNFGSQQGRASVPEPSGAFWTLLFLALWKPYVSYHARFADLPLPQNPTLRIGHED